MGFMQTATGDGEDFKVYVKYNAKAGRWYTKEDKPDANEFEVSDMTAVFDFAEPQDGLVSVCARRCAGQAVERRACGSWAVKPSPDFKQGFQINVFSNKNLLGVREFASTAGAVIDAMNAVYDDYTRPRRSPRTASCRSSSAWRSSRWSASTARTTRPNCRSWAGLSARQSWTKPFRLRSLPPLR
jgi:hypothetical protein